MSSLRCGPLRRPDGRTRGEVDGGGPPSHKCPASTVGHQDRFASLRDRASPSLDPRRSDRSGQLRAGRGRGRLLGPVFGPAATESVRCGDQRRTPADTLHAWIGRSPTIGPIWGSRGRRFKSCRPDRSGQAHHAWPQACPARRPAALDESEHRWLWTSTWTTTSRRRLRRPTSPGRRGAGSQLSPVGPGAPATRCRMCRSIAASASRSARCGAARDGRAPAAPAARA